MGTLNLTLPDGRSGTVQVGDDFASLSSDKQASTIEDIKSALAPHNSFSADLQGGVHDLGTSVSQGLNVAGGIMSRNGMPEWGGDVSGAGGWVQSHTPDQPAGPAPSEQLAGAIKDGNWSSVPGLVAHSAVRALPSAAPILAAGAVGGPLAAGAAAGGLAIGPESYARAANNGRTEPTTGDVVSALPGAAGQAVGGALLPGASKIASPLGRAAYRVGSDVAGGAIMDTSGQLGASVGTDKGTQYDPYQTAGSALTQGAIGAGRSVKAGVGDGVKAASDQLMARTLDPPATREDAESVIRIGQSMDAAKQADINSTGKPRPDTAIANTVKQDLVTKLNGHLADLKRAGLIAGSDASDLSSLINTQAYRSNNTITDADGSLFSRLSQLNLPDDVLGQLKDDVRDLNTVSSQSFIKNTVGPAQAAGAFLGKWGGTAAELAHGNVPGALMATMLGHPAGKIGGAIGAGADRLMGTNTPPIVLQRINAQRVLRQMGADPNSVSPTGDAVTPLVDGAARATAASGVQSAASDFAAQSANDQAAMDTQAEQAAKAKQAQQDAAWKQNQAFNTQVGKAYDANQPDVSVSPDDYLSGKANDPSLLPQTKMTTAQEIALQVQRLRNAQVLNKQQTQQGKLFGQAAAGDTDSMGQSAIDKLTLKNATTLAAALKTPSTRSDVPPEASQAAQDTMKSRADRILGNVDDADIVGNPKDVIPVNTPIRATTPTPPAAPAVSALPPLRVDTPATVRTALDQADQQLAPAIPSAPPQGAAQRLQQAQATLAPASAPTPPTASPGAFTPGSKYLANTLPGATHADAVKIARAAEAAGAVPKGTADLVDKSPAPLDRQLLEAIKAHAAGTPVSGGYVNTVRNPLAYAHNLKQEGDAADTASRMAPELAHIVAMMRDPTANGKTKAGRRAVLNGYLSTIPDPAVRSRAAAILTPLAGYGQD